MEQIDTTIEIEDMSMMNEIKLAKERYGGNDNTQK